MVGYQLTVLKDERGKLHLADSRDARIPAD